jgi:hypothetical protein
MGKGTLSIDVELWERRPGCHDVFTVHGLSKFSTPTGATMMKQTAHENQSLV